MSAIDRALDYVQKSDRGCWEWTGTKDAKGYGVIKDSGRMFKAHRVVYESLIGPIPPELHIDHLCLNPGCVNPEHLEPVTGAENTRRARALQARKVVCSEGHLMAATNLALGRSAAGELYARCRECQNRRQRERWVPRSMRHAS